MKIVGLIVITMFILIGCAETITVPKEVYVPVRCKIEKPAKPSDTGDVVQNNTHILIYTELLKKDLDFCVDGIQVTGDEK